MADPLQYERYEGGSAEAERLLFVHRNPAARLGRRSSV